MKLGQPLFSTKLSGAVGGIVGATARGGVLYARRRVDPSNPQTPLQALVRSVMTSLTTAWRSTLTDSQRAGWAAKADPKESGIDVYVKANFQQLLTGIAAAVTTAPASVALGDTPIDSVGTYDIGDEELNVTTPAGTARMYAVYLSKPQSASRLARQYPYAFTLTEGPGATAITISASSGVLLGVTAGQVFYVRFVCFGSASPNLGRVGQAQEFRVVCAA